MKLDEYQIQHHNRITDNLYSYSMNLNELKNRADVYSDVYYVNQISSLLDHLNNVIKDIKELEIYSAKKVDKEAKDNA